jgi:regulator of protease activity HflC (stomatin/prohibitin superfamily)
VIGKTDLDGVQSNRRSITQAIEEDLRAVTEEWGIVLSRVEIVDVEVDDETRSAMQLQLNAERNRRAVVRQAEGEREAAQLKADADLYTAQKQAEARKTLADADAYAVTVVAKAIASGGDSAINFEIKKIQAKAIETVGSNSSSKVVLIPSELLESLSSVASRLVGK